VLFCDQEETIHHLFIACPFAKILWRIVHMAFNIYPPTNITNLFGNWLNGVEKKEKARIRVACVLCYGLFGMFEIILSLIDQLFHHFCRYSSCYPFDPYVVLSPTAGGALIPGFWVQPFGNGCMEYVQPIRLAV
jgi:hypothetical protein